MKTANNSIGIIYNDDRIITIKAKSHKYNTSKNITTMEAARVEKSNENVLYIVEKKKN